MRRMQNYRCKANLLTRRSSGVYSFILGLVSIFKDIMCLATQELMSVYEVCLYDAQRLGIYAGRAFSAVSARTAADLKTKNENKNKSTIALCQPEQKLNSEMLPKCVLSALIAQILLLCAVLFDNFFENSII